MQWKHILQLESILSDNFPTPEAFKSKIQNQLKQTYTLIVPHLVVFNGGIYSQERYLNIWITSESEFCHFMNIAYTKIIRKKRPKVLKFCTPFKKLYFHMEILVFSKKVHQSPKNNWNSATRKLIYLSNVKISEIKWKFSCKESY